MTHFVLYFDYAALVILLSLTVEYKLRNTVSSRQTNAFLRILVTAILATSFDILSAWACENASVLPMWAVHIINVCYNLAFQGMGPAYYWYSMVCTSNKCEKLSHRDRFLLYGHYAVSVVLAVLSPFFGLMYYFDENFVYHQGPTVYWAYYAAFFYIVSSLARTFSRNATRKFKLLVIVYTSVILAALAMQFVFSDTMFINFGMSIGILFVSFTRENPLYYESQFIDCYNGNAFQTVMEKYIYQGRSFTVIGIRVEGLKELRGIVGSKVVNNTLNDIGQFLISISSRDRVYYISANEFAMLVTGGPAEMEMFAKRIRNRFIEPFEVSNEKVHLKALMSRFECPTDAATTEEVVNLLEYSLLNVPADSKELVTHAKANMLEERRRTGQVLQVLRKALEEKLFTVNYQPIYSVEKDCFTSAEAYVYLNDEKLGSISPAEFIPVAEKNGLISAIGEYVFDETCRFIAENQLWELGIEYIAVNLSPMQCIQEDLHIKLSEIMEKYGLDYHRISLEVTDANGILKGKAPADNMQILINKGMHFSLDNYGTGFANLNTVVEYPFNIVKLDRSMLWNAMKNEKAMTVLRQTIRMMKQLSMELIAVGVETEEQAQLLAYYGCDFFQGYYYAKPMGSDEFMAFVAEAKAKKEEKAEEA